MTTSSPVTSILGRSRFESEGNLSPLQLQVDSLESNFVNEATSATTLAAMAAGGMAFRLGRIGTLALGEGRLGMTPLRLLSLGVGLSSEVGAFELTHRTLQSVSGSENPNLWVWSGQGGWAQGLASSFITFGMLKSAGFLGREQNLVFQHALQSSTMVLGQNLAGAFNLVPHPEGSLTEQLLHAEVTNLQLGAGNSLVQSLAPEISSLEQSLDLSLRTRSSIELRMERPTGASTQEAFAEVSPGLLPPESSENFDPSQSPQLVFSMGGRREGSRRKGSPSTVKGGTNASSTPRPEPERISAWAALRRELARSRSQPVSEDQKRELIREMQSQYHQASAAFVEQTLLQNPELTETLPALLEQYPESLDFFLGTIMALQRDPTFGKDPSHTREELISKVTDRMTADTRGQRAMKKIQAQIPKIFENFIDSSFHFVTDGEARGHFIRVQSGIRRAEDALVRADLRFLYSAAWDNNFSSSDILDLIQEGGLGLIKGAHHFDLNRMTDDGEPVKFLTYANWWVEHYMTRFQVNTRKNIRIPVHQMDRINRLRKAIAEREVLGQSTDAHALTKILGMEEGKVRELMRLNSTLEEHSLDKPLAGGDEGTKKTRLDLIPDEGQRPDQEAISRRDYQSLRRALEEFRDSLGSSTHRQAIDDLLNEESSTIPPAIRRKLARFITARGFEPSLQADSGSFEAPNPPAEPLTHVGWEPRPEPKPEPIFSTVSWRPPLPSSIPPEPPKMEEPTLPYFAQLELRESLKPRIAILGFGAAGMGVSHYLRLPHLISNTSDYFQPAITVFEGLSWPGGKIAPQNLGAQFADAFQFEPVTSMIQRLNLNTHSVPDYDQADYLTREGVLMKGVDFILALQTLRGAAREALRTQSWEDLDQFGAVDFILELHRSGKITAIQKEAMLSRLGFEEGTTDISSLSFAINLSKSLTPMPRLEIEGGFYRLPQAEMLALMAAGGEVHLNTPIERVDVREKGVRVYFNRGGLHASEDFDFAVVALSPEHLSSVDIRGSRIPFEILSRLKPARIRKTNLIVSETPPGHEIATHRYAKWFSNQPKPAVTFFSGWDGGDPLSLEEMVDLAFEGKLPVELAKVDYRNWDGRPIENGISHAYTTIPTPGQGLAITRLAREQFFEGRYDSDPLRFANHVLGLGCYVRDGALAGEWAAISILRSLGLSLKPSAQRNRDPRREFFGIEFPRSSR
jgi:DNA-directed RNA polymerase sigma subunit (sigma70/sigma32)